MEPWIKTPHKSRIYLLTLGSKDQRSRSQHIDKWKHTCEPSDGRLNSPVFLGHLPIWNILPNSPDFYMFLPYSPDFDMFMSQMCNLHPVHLGQGSKMQFEWYTCGILNPLHTAEVFYSHFKVYIPNLGWLFHSWLMIIWIFVSFNSKFQNNLYIFKIN